MNITTINLILTAALIAALVVIHWWDWRKARQEAARCPYVAALDELAARVTPHEMQAHERRRKGSCLKNPQRPADTGSNIYCHILK